MVIGEIWREREREIGQAQKSLVNVNVRGLKSVRVF